MSSKSTGPHLLVPDEPVKEYSGLLNSYYEMLHRFYSTLLELPGEIGAIKYLIDVCKNYFYEIRNLLEEDYGIHPYTAKMLEVPECGDMLRQLVQWEENFETAKREYLRRQKNETDAVKYEGDYIELWRNVRYTLWNVERCLRITQERAITNDNKYPLGETPPQYPWVKKELSDNWSGYMVEFEKAYFIKLGSCSKWAKNCFETNRIRIGWKNIPINLIRQKEWEEIYRINRITAKDDGSATRDSNALKNIIEANEKTIFITFENSVMFWSKPSNINTVDEDDISKFRLVDGSWSNKDVSGNLLYINKLPGAITKVQRFSGTSCSVRDVEILRRLINCQTSEYYKNICKAKEVLEKSIEISIKDLHWKDFELLVDLIFRETGLKRISVLGESMKFVDLELKHPITGDLYQVQIKSATTKKQFQKYVMDFDSDNYRRLFYVVHTCDDDITDHSLLEGKDVEVWTVKEIAIAVVKYGLVEWVIEKCS